jgi:hypothetical protein
MTSSANRSRDGFFAKPSRAWKRQRKIKAGSTGGASEG